ncbi:hypothetical protein BGZ83_004373 [Gryganskiella cystojenkinii]|nr:hypothetical protein BGZ83_004373 [Gryganskiella cystojenkinii]
MAMYPGLALDWLPRSQLKKLLILLIIMIFILVSTMNLEVDYHTWRNRMEVGVLDLKIITARSLDRNAAHLGKTKYDIYMYLGCTASPFAAVFWTISQAVKVCDLHSADRMCDVKLTRDYTYDELAIKTTEWLNSERFQEMLDQNEVLVKLDDDTIVSKDTLDGMVADFVQSECKFAGTMRQTQAGLFWASGPLFLVKTDYMKQQLRDNGHVLQYYTKEEDVQMSDLLSIYDKNLVCSLDVDAFKHRYYEDRRVSIRYKPYVKC